MTSSRNAHFENKGQNESKNRGRQTNDQKGSKKLRFQVEYLQKELNDQTQLSEIVAVIMEDQKPGTVLNTNTDEKSISMERNVMKIVQRKKSQILHNFHMKKIPHCQLNLMSADWRH